MMQFQLRKKIRNWTIVKLASVALAISLSPALALGADIIPMEVQMPGTQPGEAGNFESPDKCDNCHQGSGANIAQEWRGSMMSHAGRDPLFWATLAIAEQDFDGSGDLCLRCHTHSGWQAGHSTPTDGSALSEAEAAEGVGCDICHKMTNPDNSDNLDPDLPLVGVQNAPFIANDGASPAEGFYGSSMLSLWPDAEKLGPYADAVPKHQWAQSLYHRDIKFCGSCHDVSNPVVGDLAPNNGAQTPLISGFDGQLDSPDNPRNIEHKAAFNHPPYKYGVVERTFSEYMAGSLSRTLVADYSSLPTDLQAGMIKVARDAALAAGTGGNYEDGTPRYFSCQTCHMRPTTAVGANKQGVPLRKDMPTHDMTGGNYWVPSAIQYMDNQGTLLLGGNLSSAEIDGLNAGSDRARFNLDNSASLSVQANTLKVINLTGHKLISGYPEGRRMWLNIVWKDSDGNSVREDGAYGSIQVSYDVNGDGNINASDAVDTLLDLDDPNTRVYEVHGGISKQWALKLISVSASYADVPVAYDRVTGLVTHTIGDVAGSLTEDAHETFHFVLNNTILKDTRIPPYGMDYDESVRRNILPVPADQYGNPTSGQVFDYWDEVELNPPAGAVSAEIRLYYQPTSWEYIHFLARANNGGNDFLANEGENLLRAWFNTGMAAPHEMASTTWMIPDTDNDGVPDSTDNCPTVPNGDQIDTDNDRQGNACDIDDDDDGLIDTEEASLGTNSLLFDSDGDTLGDGDEVSAGLNPLSTDSDGDTYTDDIDPLPSLFNHEDGDVAPYGLPDGNINAGDLLIGMQLVLGIKQTTDLERSHMDLYPQGAPDGNITLSDYILLQQLAW